MSECLFSRALAREATDMFHPSGSTCARRKLVSCTNKFRRSPNLLVLHGLRVTPEDKPNCPHNDVDQDQDDNMRSKSKPSSPAGQLKAFDACLLVCFSTKAPQVAGALDFLLSLTPRSLLFNLSPGI